MPQLDMQHDKDPREAIVETAGDLSGVEVLFSQVLIGVYQRPAKTQAGIHLPDNYRDEDLYQGAVGLVLKLGPLAFQSLATDSADVKIGDWVAIRPSDSIGVSVRKQKCRLVRDDLVRMKIPSPDAVF